MVRSKILLFFSFVTFFRIISAVSLFYPFNFSASCGQFPSFPAFIRPQRLFPTDNFQASLFLSAHDGCFLRTISELPCFYPPTPVASYGQFPSFPVFIRPQRLFPTDNFQASPFSPVALTKKPRQKPRQIMLPTYKSFLRIYLTGSIWIGYNNFPCTGSI